MDLPREWWPVRITRAGENLAFCDGYVKWFNTHTSYGQVAEWWDVRK